MKKKQHTQIPTKARPVGKASSGLNGSSADRLILFCYFLVGLLPSFDSIDSMGAHWFFISVLNIISGIYLYRNREKADLSFIRNLPSVCYSVFVFISALSFFAAFNIEESIVAFSRLLTTYTAFIAFAALISSRRALIGEVFTLMAVICIVESFNVYQELIRNASLYTNMNDVIYYIRGNTGNKNILAASLAVKLPALIYLVLERKGRARMAFAIILLFSVSAIALLNARASYLGAIAGLMIMIAGKIFLNRRTPLAKIYLKGGLLVIGLFVAGVALSESVFHLASKGKKMQNYTSAIDRASSIGMTNEASTGRIQYWGFALDFISLHPVIGGGIGNWKIHEIPYEKHFRNGFGCAKHVHNDFLEVTTDTGLPGGLAYTAIFMALIFLLFRILFRRTEGPDQKGVYLTIAAVFAVYSIDALLNFPMERPVMQVMFSFTAASIMVSGFRDSEKKPIPRTAQGAALIVLLGLSLSTTFISYKVFKSFRYQSVIAGDWSGAGKATSTRVTAQEVMNRLPDFPNINEQSGIPIECVKAKYLVVEKRYAEAFRLLDNKKSSNPYHYYGELIRSKAYEEIGNMDSAMYYARLAFENRPSNLQLFQHYNGMLAKTMDSSAVRRTYQEFRKWNKNPQGCHAFVLNIFFCTRNVASFMDDLTAAYLDQPLDSTLHFDYAFYRGGSYQNQERYQDAIKSYEEALPFRPADEYVRSNLAYCYLYLREYGKALPLYNTLIEDYPGSGKYYNYRAMCHFNLKDKVSACRDIDAALRSGFQVQDEMRKSCSN